MRNFIWNFNKILKRINKKNIAIIFIISLPQIGLLKHFLFVNRICIEMYSIEIFSDIFLDLRNVFASFQSLPAHDVLYDKNKQ